MSRNCGGINPTLFVLIQPQTWMSFQSITRYLIYLSTELMEPKCSSVAPETGFVSASFNIGLSIQIIHNWFFMILLHLISSFLPPADFHFTTIFSFDVCICKNEISAWCEFQAPVHSFTHGQCKLWGLGGLCLCSHWPKVATFVLTDFGKSKQCLIQPGSFFFFF